MKFQNLSAFEKHLQQGAKLSPSRLYLVISSCPYERRKIVEKIALVLGVKEQIEEASSAQLEEQVAEWNTASLFSGKQLVYLDGVDKLKKNGLAMLAEYAAHPSPFTYLLLGAGSAKPLDDLYTKGKKELIVCDLSNEKPWDRKERLKRMLVEEAAKEGKRLKADAVEYLLENVGLSLAGLDVQALCGAQKSATPWQLAEAIVWKENPMETMGKIDLTLLFPLIFQMRSQLQNGLMIATLLERGAAHEGISHYLPAVKSAALDRMLPIVKKRRSVYFRRALDSLFEMELMAKNSSFEPDLLLDLLMAKFTLYSRA
jgi:DNA polymerase-3 subunit delta